MSAWNKAREKVNQGAVSGRKNPGKTYASAYGVENVTHGNFSVGGMGKAGSSGALGKFDVVGKALDEANPWLQGKNAAKAKGEADKIALEKKMSEIGALQPKYDTADADYLSKFETGSKTYLDSAKGQVGEYKAKVNELDTQAKDQSTKHSSTYTNDILPGYKNAMESAKNNADGAMTLQEAMDPNNPLASQIRDLYNRMGEDKRQQGLRDFGALSALGAQSAQGQFGASGPMTAGAMGQIYAQNQNQAGNAYAAAQKRMYDLEQQGITRGFEDTKHWYDKGQQAQERYSGTVKDFQGGEDQFYDQQGQFRDEIGGYAGDILGVDSALNADIYNMGMTGAGINKQNTYAKTGREESMINQNYGGAQTISDSEMAARMANYGSQAQFISSLAGAGASAMSDEDEKEEIKDIGDDQLDEFLSALEPKTFKYKDQSKPGTQPGQRVGFMMQDVEGTQLGDQMSTSGPNGEKMYDKDNLIGILLAALKRENEKAA